MGKASFSIEEVMSRVLRAAQMAKEDAGWSGRMDDGGASEMATQVEYYRYGMEGVIPPEWEYYVNELKCEKDPEWVEYRRLKEKFGGR